MLEHVENALKLVQVSRGFYTDIGLGVIAREREQTPEDAVTPCTVLLATEMPVDEQNSTSSQTRTDMEIVIEFSVPFSDNFRDAQRIAHRGRADVIRALMPLRKKLKERPAGVLNFEITGSGIDQPEPGSTTVIAQVTARAALSESLSPANP